MNAEDRLFCSFRLAEHLFGIDIAVVQEVLRRQEITRLPLAAQAVRGVINLRGRIVPAVDLRCCIGMGPDRADRDPANIVVRASGAVAVSLLVDDVGEVIAVPAEAYERTPETLRGSVRDLIQGVYKLQDELLLVLDIGRVMRAAAA